MKKLLPLFIILVICLSFFYQTITKGLLPVPTDTLIGLYHPWLDQAAITSPAGVPFKNFLITDPIRQQIPWRKLVIDDLKKGAVPSWNPFNFSGTALLANIQAGTWYPLNILFFVFPFVVAWTILIVAQPVLAALFLYFYLRNKNISASVAVLGGLVWAFCGFSVAWLTWGTIAQTALWLPLILLAIDKRSWILFIAASTLALFAGHAQVALYIFAFAGVYAILKRSWWIIPAVVAAGILSSIQWIPMLQLISHSSRIIDTTAWLKDGWFLPWQNLVQFAAPDFFGNPATLNYWGIWNYGEFIGYIGIIPLMLAVYAVCCRRDKLTAFFAVVLAVALIFLLPTPVAALIYKLKIPVLFSLQPTRLMVIVDFCLVVLAACGLDAYIKRPDKKILLGITLVGVLIAGIWMYVVRSTDVNLLVSRRNLMLPSGTWAAGSLLLLLPLFLKKKWHIIVVQLIIVVTVFDLFRFGWKFTPFTPSEYFFPVTNAVSFLQGQQPPFRVMSLDNRIMPPNTGAYYGIESIEGYDPIYDARYEEFIAALNRRAPNITPPFGFNRIITTPTIDSPLLPILNVKYVLTLEDVVNPAMELVYREGSTRIYAYKKALPRVYAVDTVEKMNTRQQVIDRLYAKTYNPAKIAIIEDVSAPISVAPHVPTDLIRTTTYTQSELDATASFAGDHFVVVSNIYDPKWKVTIDGKPVQTYRTDYICIGFVVPKGDHVITLRYE